MSNTESAESRDTQFSLNDTLSRINEFVSRRGISQAKLSRRLNLSKQSVSRLLRGQQTMTVEHVLAFAIALDATPQDFLGVQPAVSPNETALLDAVRSRDHHRIEHALIALDVRLLRPPVKNSPTDAEEGDRVSLAAQRIRESADTIQLAAEALRDAADVLIDT